MAKKDKTNIDAFRREDEKKLSRGERKERAKALRKSQLELETQLVNEGKIPARNKYRCRNFFGRAMALVLAFLFGIVATVGTVLGLGAFLPVGDVMNLFGLDPYALFYEDYAAMSALDIVRDVISNPFDSLEGIAKYSPVVDSYVDTIAESLSSLGIQLNKKEFKATAFADLGTYFRDDVINSMELGKALKVTPNESNRLMVAICYGNRGVDYTIDDAGNIVPISQPVTLGELSSDSQSVIDRVNVEDAFDVTAQSNEAMLFLAYGTKGLNYDVTAEGTIEMLVNELTGEPFPKKTIADITGDGETPLDDAKISDLIEITPETEGLLAAIKDWTTGDLKQSYRIERLKINQVMTIDENSSLIAKAIQDWRLCDIKDPKKTDTLRLGDIITIDENSPPMLKALENTQIGELSTAVDELRLMDVLKEEDIKDNNFLKSLKLSRLPDLGADLKKLSAREVFGEDMYSYREIKPEKDMSVYELYKEYRDTNRNKEVESANIPEAHTFTDGEEVRSYFEATRGGGTWLQRGFYTEKDGIKTAVPESKVHIEKSAAEGADPTIKYYIEEEQKLTPTYGWKLVDYENEEHLVPLPEGDEITKAPEKLQGRIVKNGKAGETPFKDADGDEWYYLTEATTHVTYMENPETGDLEPVETKEPVAYRLLQDDYGIYYTYLKFTPDGGTEEFAEERVDLERVITFYQYSAGGDTVTLTRNADGDWSYTPKQPEGAEEVAVTVYTRAAETKTEADPETGAETTTVVVPAYDYIKVQVEVKVGYYDEEIFARMEAAEEAEGGAEPSEPVDLTISNVYGEDAVTEKFEIVKIVEGAVQGQATPVERYLSGAWFFLFAAQTDEDGNVTYCDGNGFFDKSDMPVLELTDIMGGMNKAVSHTPLWELYFHGLLTDNPFVALNGQMQIGENHQVSNLNECTLTESVELVKELVALTKGEP